ncbi:uncharacterized protein LOC129238529 [Anastrepha obliqua]|uniref:uncharacterized protein LOC129238529 n=1 Tax=Anastrepha obliqua TaxID=95512 RepID=UPI002409A3A1|nr:uncharacterized protein LOC129238529 [Anastrepha obliqua]
MMKGLQIQNLKKLETINKINKVGLTSNTALTISIIIAVILLALKIFGKRKPKDFQRNCNKPNALGTPESTEMRTGTSALEEGGANATPHIPQPKYDGNPTPHMRNVLANATVHTPEPKYAGNPTLHTRNGFEEIPEQRLAFPWETPIQQSMGHVAGTRA